MSTPPIPTAVEDSYDDVDLADSNPAVREAARPLSGGCCSTRGVMCALTLALGCVCALCGALLAVATYSSPIYTPVEPARYNATPVDPHATMRGVNLGGWLVLEPWITPSLFYQFLDDKKPAVVDERTLCERLGPKEAQRQLDVFRRSWVNETVFKRLASLGVNTVRLPYGYWAFGDRPEFCPNVTSIEYVDLAVGWAKKHGLRVVLDLHGVMHSQNGFDNSGDTHKPPFGRPLNATAWLGHHASAVAIDVLGRVARRYAEEEAVVAMGLVNEPIGFALSGFCESGCPIPQDQLLAFYRRAWAAIRANNTRVTPVLDVSFRSDIWGVARAEGEPWLEADAVLDTHRYHGWWPQGSEVAQVVHLRRAGCGARDEIAEMERTALPTVVGEWSLAISDCMTWLNGMGLDASFTRPSACGRVKCPERFGKLPPFATGSGEPRPQAAIGGPDENGQCPVDPLVVPRGRLSYDEFYTLFAHYALRGYEASRGWTFWNFHNELQDPRWGFLDAANAGWVPSARLEAFSPPVPPCDSSDAWQGLDWHVLLYMTIVSGVALCLALPCLACAACGRCPCQAEGRGRFQMMLAAGDGAGVPLRVSLTSPREPSNQGAVELSAVRDSLPEVSVPKDGDGGAGASPSASPGANGAGTPGV